MSLVLVYTTLAASARRPPPAAAVGAAAPLPPHLLLLRPACCTCRNVPCGPEQLVMPYLVRRAQENSGMMGGLAAQVAQLRGELGRRLLGRGR